MSNEIWSGVKEGIDAMGDMLMSAIDRVGSAVQSKAGSMLGGLGQSISNGFGSAKASVLGGLTPNGIGLGKSDNSPNIGPSKAVSPSQPDIAPTQSKDFGDMLQSSGFSMESLEGTGVQATDLGQAASVGLDGVGCASHDAPRAAVAQSQALVR